MKREKEDDEKALAVRRERLHELESERLGLTDVCRYETTVVGEEEESRPQGVDNGNRANPIPLEDAAGEEPQSSRPGNSLYQDLEPMESNSKSRNSDPVAPIVELLRKRQREEREEADIRREEQVLLNKRLAMMEDQVQMLSKLITQRERKSQPALPPQSEVIDLDGGSNESAEIANRPQAEAGAAGASNITEAPAGTTEQGEVHDRPQAEAEVTNVSSSTEARAEIAEVSPDVPMPDISANTAAGAETAALGTGASNDVPTGAVEYSPNVSMDGSADVPDKTPAGSEIEMPDDRTEAQNDVNKSPKTIDAPMTAEAVPEGGSAVQATEPADEESPATPISEEE